MALNSFIIYRVKFYDTKTKEGMNTSIEFRKKDEAEIFVRVWKAQGESFDAELIEEVRNEIRCKKDF